MSKSPETFYTGIEVLVDSKVSQDDLDAVRARLNREPDAQMLLEALGFEPYDARERVNTTGIGRSSRVSPKPVRRRAMWGPA